MADHFRAFTIAEGHVPPGRVLDDGAPAPLRHEFVDLVFTLAETEGQFHPERLHRVATQSIGVHPSANPHGGFRYAVGRDLGRADWYRVYDLMVRLWREFDTVGHGPEYTEGVRAILAAHGIAWDMDDAGQLHRVMQPEAQAAVDAAADLLADPRFDTARPLFHAARDAYDARPRRDRDACVNVFAALEAVGQTVQEMEGATFDAVLNRMRQTRVLTGPVLAVLSSLNVLRHQTFGHGTDFPFRAAEVEFVYSLCAAGIALLARDGAAGRE